jgi:hypothetical protein
MLPHGAAADIGQLTHIEIRPAWRIPVTGLARQACHRPAAAPGFLPSWERPGNPAAPGIQA